MDNNEELDELCDQMRKFEISPDAKQQPCKKRPNTSKGKPKSDTENGDVFAIISVKQCNYLFRGLMPGGTMRRCH